MLRAVGESAWPMGLDWALGIDVFGLALQGCDCSVPFAKSWYNVIVLS